MGKKIAAIKEKEEIKEARMIGYMARTKNDHRQKNQYYKENVFNLNTYFSQKQRIDFNSLILRPESQFKFKSKSKDEVRLNKEISIYFFEKFTTPNFLRPLTWKDISISQVLGEKSYKCTFGNTLQWYFCVAQGGSLYKTYLKGLFTKKEVHIFLNQKVTENIGDALVFAIAMSESGNYSLATTLSRSKIGDKFQKLLFTKNINTTMTIYEDVQKKRLTEMIAMVRLFSRLMEKRTINEIDDIVDYIFNRMDNDQTYTVVGKGYTYDILKKATVNWHHDLRRNKISVEFMGKKWLGYGLGEQDITMTLDGDNILRTFSEILDGGTLDREGKTQRHCVYSYLHSCMTGYCSIVRMHNGGYKSMVTLEIRKGNYGSMTLVQARRFANQKPKDQEQKFIMQWAKNNNINIGQYVF